MAQFRPAGGFQLLPTVVKNLLIINGLVFLLQIVMDGRGIDLSDTFGLHYWRSPMFRPWQPLTHLFLHGSFTHLLSNMFGLWMFGSVLENTFGPKRFLTYYLLCGLGAALLHSIVVGYEFHLLEDAFAVFQRNPTFDQYEQFLFGQKLNGISYFEQMRALWREAPQSSAYAGPASSLIAQHLQEAYNAATIGASGAVFGILFAFGYLFPNQLIFLYFFFPLKAKYFVALYAAFELYAGIQNSAGDNIAHFAHLGGLIIGFVLLRLWRVRSFNRRS